MGRGGCWPAAPSAVVGDAVGEVAVPDLVDPLRQGLQGLLDVPEHEPGEEAVGDQHRRQDHHHRRGQEGGRQVLRLVGQVGDHPLAVDLQLIGDPPGGIHRAEKVRGAVGDGAAALQSRQGLGEAGLVRGRPLAKAPGLPAVLADHQDHLMGGGGLLQTGGQGGLLGGVSLRQPILRQGHQLAAGLRHVVLAEPGRTGLGQQNGEEEQQRRRHRQHPQASRDDNHQNVGQEQSFFDGHRCLPP